MKLSIIILYTSIAAATSSTVRIYKIEKSSGSNGAVVTYKNYGSESVDVSGYYVGSDNRHIPIHSTENNSLYVRGVGPVIPPGMTWTIDYTPWASQGSSGGKLSQSSDIALWSSNNYYYSENLVDFVQYCNVGSSASVTCPNFGEWISASLAGKWSGGHVRVTGYPVTLVFVGQGENRGPSFWSLPGSPTPSPTTAPPTNTPTTASPTNTPSTTPPTSSPSTAPPTNGPSPSPLQVTNQVPCQQVTASVYELLFKLLALRQQLGC